MLRCHPPSQESVDTQFSNNTCASAHGGAKPTSGPASSCRNSLQRGVALPQIQEPAPLPLTRNAQHNTGRAGPLFPATQGAIVKAFSPQWRGSLRAQGSEHNIITTYFEAQGLLTRKHEVKGLGGNSGYYRVQHEGRPMQSSKESRCSAAMRVQLPRSHSTQRRTHQGRRLVPCGHMDCTPRSVASVSREDAQQLGGRDQGPCPSGRQQPVPVRGLESPLECRGYVWGCAPFRSRSSENVEPTSHESRFALHSTVSVC